MRLLEAEIQALNNTAEKNGKTEPDRPVTPSKGTKKGGKVVRLVNINHIFSRIFD